ncbi:inosose dehydratase, partial [Pseudarthrobacter phenanthrenivorans]
TDAVREGVYVPLGDGDVDFRTIASQLGAAHFEGWWVLEQDTILTNEPADNEGPIRDVLRSFQFLHTLS